MNPLVGTTQPLSSGVTIKVEFCLKSQRLYIVVIRGYFRAHKLVRMPNLILVVFVHLCTVMIFVGQITTKIKILMCMLLIEGVLKYLISSVYTYLKVVFILKDCLMLQILLPLQFFLVLFCFRKS